MEKRTIAKEYLTVNEKGEIVWVEVRDEEAIKLFDTLMGQRGILETEYVNDYLFSIS